MRELRHELLRPHQPPEACSFPGDDAPDTQHFGAYLDGQLCGIASVYHESAVRPPAAGDKAWRLRGMATTDTVQGSGLGRALVEACAAHASALGGETLWCNARVPAAGFYERCGFTSLGDIFELPEIGPHLFMYRALADGFRE